MGRARARRGGARAAASLRGPPRPVRRRPAAFFACWTRKEAFVKATGDGLGRPLAAFEVSLAPGDRARLLSIDGSPATAAAWSLHALTPAPGVAAAIALRGAGWRLVTRDAGALLGG